MLDVPASHLHRALELFAEAVTEPSLAERDVNRHVQLRLAEIEQAQANSRKSRALPSGLRFSRRAGEQLG